MRKINMYGVLLSAHFILIVSSVQILEEEPFEALRPTMESMIADKDQDSQRAAAELIAGVIGGIRRSSRRQNTFNYLIIQARSTGPPANRRSSGSGLIPSFKRYLARTSRLTH